MRLLLLLALLAFLPSTGRAETDDLTASGQEEEESSIHFSSVSEPLDPPQPEWKPSDFPKVSARTCRSTGCVYAPNLPSPDFKKFEQGPKRIQAFSNYYGPQALALQKATGYPASLMLAQWAEESGWGSSANYRDLNNIAGHRCWKNGEQKTVKIQIPGMETTITTTCAREANKGILYLKFSSPLDATLGYVQNLLYAENTAKAYKAIREEVKRAKPADWRKIMPALRNYCPLEQYQKNIPALLKNNKFEQWEKKELCSCS